MNRSQLNNWIHENCSRNEKNTKQISEYLNYHKKLKVLHCAKQFKNNKEAYALFGIKKSTFYKWKKEYKKEGEQGLLRKKPIHELNDNQIS